MKNLYLALLCLCLSFNAYSQIADLTFTELNIANSFIKLSNGEFLSSGITMKLDPTAGPGVTTDTMVRVGRYISEDYEWITVVKENDDKSILCVAEDYDDNLHFVNLKEDQSELNYFGPLLLSNSSSDFIDPIEIQSGMIVVYIGRTLTLYDESTLEVEHSLEISGSSIKLHDDFIFSSSTNKLVKYNYSGTVIWERTLQDKFSYRDMVINQEGEIFLVGEYELPNNREHLGVISKFDKDGWLLSSKVTIEDPTSYGLIPEIETTHLEILNNGNILSISLDNKWALSVGSSMGLISVFNSNLDLISESFYRILQGGRWGYRTIDLRPNSDGSIDGLGRFFGFEKPSLAYIFTISEILSHSVEVVSPEGIMYPNPVVDEVTIQNMHGDQVKIFDTAGKLMLNSAFVEQLDLSALDSGIYYMQISTEDLTNVIRFVKM